MGITRGIFRVIAFALPLLAVGCGGGQPADSPSSDGPSAGPLGVSRDNPCSVMLPSEVAEILGLPSELREVMDEVTCRYHFTPSESTPTPPGEETFIEVKVYWTDGRMAVAAARMAGQLLGGDASGFEQIPDVGDEAWMAPFASYLAFSRGDVGVEIDMRMLPGERDKAVGLARLIAGRL